MASANIGSKCSVPISLGVDVNDTTTTSPNTDIPVQQDSYNFPQGQPVVENSGTMGNCNGHPQPPPYFNTTEHSPKPQQEDPITVYNRMKKRAALVKFGTVASLPFNLSGYNHMSNSQRVAAPTLQQQGLQQIPSAKRASPYRKIASWIHTCKGKKHPVEKDSYTTHSCPDGYQITMRHGIRPGEVEWRIRHKVDWTQEWEWTLTVSYTDNDWDPMQAWGVFYFNNLPARLGQVVPWKDESQTSRVRKRDTFGQNRNGIFWSCRRFCDRGESPQWSAWFTTCDWDRQRAKDLNPWDVLASWPVLQ